MDLFHVLLDFSFGVRQQVSLTLREGEGESVREYKGARRDRGAEGRSGGREVEREQKR